jgi:hypothetical protein
MPDNIVRILHNAMILAQSDKCVKKFALMQICLNNSGKFHCENVVWVLNITNWDREPIFILETLEVEIKGLSQMDEGFAYHEGEGDRHWIIEESFIGVFSLKSVKSLNTNRTR